MVVSILLFALFIFVCTSVLFFMFCFFIPALASVFNGGGVGLLANTGNILPEEEKYSDVVYTTTLQAHIEQPETDTERLHFRGVQNCAIFQAAYDSHENGVQRCIGYALSAQDLLDFVGGLSRRLSVKFDAAVIIHDFCILLLQTALHRRF